MAHANEELIVKFYDCFNRRDADGMTGCYGPGARFEDPVFGKLDERQVKAMWRMLLGSGTDVRVVVSKVVADEAQGSARWDATYTFRQTGRVVNNSIDASFRFHEGRIVEHHDVFSLRRWIGMALGPVQGALGWLPMLQNKVKAGARGRLDAFLRTSG
jgi:ketosteroid isomerase-like protein